MNKKGLVNSTSAYTLSETSNSSGDNVITKYNIEESSDSIEYTDENGTVQTLEYTTKEAAPVYYEVNLKQTTYGTGSNTKYFEWTKDTDGNYTFSEVTEPTNGKTTITVKYDDSNATSTRQTSFTSGADIEQSFIGAYSTTDSGAAIYNNGSTIGNITGYFIDNYVSKTSNYASGGAIYNTGTISGIAGNFIGNYASTSGTYAYGGAIFNSNEINTISGNFIGNYSSTTGSNYAYGGAIYNSKKIGDIDADFIGNSASSASGANGGAVYNSGTIDNITGDFIANYADAYSTTSKYGANGGAVYNSGTIGNITGDFIGNYVYSATSKRYVMGGAIGNYFGTIAGDITGDFIGNYAKSTGSSYTSSYSLGGAIYNSGTTGKITGDFINNYASSDASYANGGAIYNSGTTGNIAGDFIENYAISTGTGYYYPYANGGAIYNTGEAGDITGNFIKNYVSSDISFANGGAIYNTGEAGDITGNFIGNYATTSGTYAQGGAIYNASDATSSIVNSSFIDNQAETTSESYLALGGAIYTNSDLDIIANDGNTSIFTDNSTKDYRGTINNAIFVQTNSEGYDCYDEDDNLYFEYDDLSPVLTLSAQNGSKIVFNDTIDGGDIVYTDIYDYEYHGAAVEYNNQYDLSLEGDSDSYIIFNNDVKNANISVDDVNVVVQDADYLNHSSEDGINSLSLNSGNLYINNLGLSSLHFQNLALNSGNINIGSVDVDLAAKEMGRITADTYSNAGTGAITIAAMNLLTDAEDITKTTAVYFADSAIENNVATTSLTAYSPIYKYTVTYDSENQYDGKGDGGYYMFSAGGSGADSYNPAVLSTPVSNQAAAQATMTETFKHVYEHADTFSILPKRERLARINSNYYAISTDYNDNLGFIAPEYKNDGLWFRPYVTIEKMNLKNGPDVNAVTYGNLVGYDSDFIKLKNGWNSVITGYIGYNGSQLRYSGVDTSMNGGLLGLTDTFYKGNFWTAVTALAGAGVGQSYNMYGKEDFTTFMSGIGTKTGYNFEFNDGKYIIQPVWNMNYSFINTFDYTNSAGVRIDSKPMNTIQLNPSVRLIANCESGWQPYSSVGFVWNLMNESKVKANNVYLPEMSIKPYVEYGLGVQKRFKDTFTAFGQAMVRNGGRKGIAFTFGLRWNIGKDNKEEL